jgi:hypothetical protein
MTRANQRRKKNDPTQTRSGRTSRPASKFADMQLLQARGDFERADEMEKILVDDYADIDRDPISLEEGEETVFYYIMMQLSLKQGVKKWGERVEAGPMKEMTQLHGLEAFFPRDPKTLTREQRIKALSSLIFLKQKEKSKAEHASMAQCSMTISARRRRRLAYSEHRQCFHNWSYQCSRGSRCSGDGLAACISEHSNG